MAGHSKWANRKHRKAKVDAQKGKIFTKLSRLITVAAREGGGDPDTNARLKDAIAKAREANLPNDNIIRAIQKGTGELEGASYEEMVYEGYGPGGVAVLLEIMTDNRNRIAGEIRHIFDKYGGSLGESGCVSWMFDKKGLIVVERKNMEMDELVLAAIDSGAEDVMEYDDYIEITTDLENFNKVKENLKNQGLDLASAEITMIPQTTVKLDEKNAERMMKLLDALEDNDDVQNVYHNWDMPEEIGG
ncbi:MAG: hypothetical protein PWP21_342 [Thermosediminibacterales bacterium]|nr:hypothetical protein [Thermosediminibacterales bacterium]